jgi:hypothetical protein
MYKGYTSINSGKNEFNLYNSVTNFFFICFENLPYTSWILSFFTDLFYDFVGILLIWVTKCKMPYNWKISVT